MLQHYYTNCKSFTKYNNLQIQKQITKLPEFRKIMKLQNQNTNIYKNEIKCCNKYKTDLQNYLLQHNIQI